MQRRELRVGAVLAVNADGLVHSGQRVHAALCTLRRGQARHSACWGNLECTGRMLWEPGAPGTKHLGKLSCAPGICTCVQDQRMPTWHGAHSSSLPELHRQLAQGGPEVPADDLQGRPTVRQRGQRAPSWLGSAVLVDAALAHKCSRPSAGAPHSRKLPHAGRSAQSVRAAQPWSSDP